LISITEIKEITFIQTHCVRMCTCVYVCVGNGPDSLTLMGASLASMEAKGGGEDKQILAQHGEEGLTIIDETVGNQGEKKDTFIY